ncbi:uncharacterized protein [Ptychodera flava]|uniref:uncharacterized protein n=1 Tax=Ptychodera flava TaxID=63121 RepID=UPI00396A5B9F
MKIGGILYVSLAVSLAVDILASASHEPRDDRKLPNYHRVLVFGGNAFIGAETVVALVSKGYQVTIVNRGNWYWDSETRIKPHVSHVVCDRSLDLLKCDDFRGLLGIVEKFDAVVDFSGYQGYQVENAARVLRGRAGLYIYISTDSVYEVCKAKNHAGRTKETDAVRPKAKTRQAELNELDHYGHEKLRGEEMLLKQRGQPDGIPYVFLRLPDVIGPRDRTNRWWFYQLWVHLSSTLATPIYVPMKLSNVPLSLVHVEDVAKVVLELIRSGEKVHDQAINIAFDESPTLAQVVTEIANALKLPTPLFDIADLGNRFYLYPTVKRGAIDTSKAKSLLSWRPAPWKERVERDVEFYEETMKTNTQQREIFFLFERFTAALVPESKQKVFVDKVINLYGPEIEQLIPKYREDHDRSSAKNEL